jgi:hypothetical protein
MTMNELHNFKVGDRVTVFNRAGRRFIVEGPAMIRKILTYGEDMYSVIFLNEKRGHHDRYVDPNGQENPQVYLELLNQEAK